MYHLLLAVIYAAFISLGLPDSLLGAAWPQMHQMLQVPVGWAGAVSATVSLCTVTSSLLSARLVSRFGTGKVTAASVLMSGLALLGFSVTNNYFLLFVWAVPYGLGAGGVDAALNNYVALHYSSRHMSWLHCMWGLGASVGPYILGYAMSGGATWHSGYRIIGLMQMVLFAFLFFSLPIWRGESKQTPGEKTRVLSLKQAMQIPGAKEVFATFFCYCALEQTCMLWTSSYLALYRGLNTQVAAEGASLFFVGITLGRAISGFLTSRLNDTALIRMGQSVIALSLVLMLLPLGTWMCMGAVFLAGLGCAPIYPCIIHSTPENFGAENSQGVIGMQMAFAYLGNLLTPPVFGLLAQNITPGLLPWFLGLLLAAMVVFHQRLLRKVGRV